MSWSDLGTALFLWAYHMTGPLLSLVPAVALAFWARWRLRRAFRGQETGTGSESSRCLSPFPAGPTGAELAESLLRAGGVEGVVIVRADGPLATCYDPARRELNLAPGIADARSPGRLAIAAHEAGHALRHAAGARTVALRTPLVFLIGWCATAAWLVILSGMLLDFAGLVERGVTLYWLALFGGLALLPLEWDANRRTRRTLADLDDLKPLDADPAFQEALGASCWAIVAGTLPPVSPLSGPPERRSVSRA